VEKPPLKGYRIISLAEQYPGPYATMILADLGADVIMVERVTGGDPTRRYSGHFESLNRNKRSLALDLKSAEGREAFLRLVDTADVLVEGFRPNVMRRLGLGADELRGRRPELIYVSISSFGQGGPLATVAGHDLSIQGAAGLLEITPGTEDSAGLPRLPLADIASGLFAALGIVTSLLARAKSREGATVDVSMLDSLISWMTPLIVPAINQLTPAPLPPKEPGYGVFATSDGRQITLSIAGEDHLWNELCAVLDLGDLVGLSEADRVARRDEILPRLRAACLQRPIDWLSTHFERHKIAFGPVLHLQEIAEAGQVAARGMISELQAGEGATIKYVRQPLIIDGRGGTIRSAAPRLGQHNDELLRELGYDEGRIPQTGKSGAGLA
jgi:crotonobetainyl-CoA:carnitine CoA-transferase CaiB-like acyl-CoA transferase